MLNTYLKVNIKFKFKCNLLITFTVEWVLTSFEHDINCHMCPKNCYLGNFLIVLIKSIDVILNWKKCWKRTSNTIKCLCIYMIALRFGINFGTYVKNTYMACLYWWVISFLLELRAQMNSVVHRQMTVPPKWLPVRSSIPVIPITWDMFALLVPM